MQVTGRGGKEMTANGIFRTDMDRNIVKALLTASDTAVAHKSREIGHSANTPLVAACIKDAGDAGPLLAGEMPAPDLMKRMRVFAPNIAGTVCIGQLSGHFKRINHRGLEFVAQPHGAELRHMAAVGPVFSRFRVCAVADI